MKTKILLLALFAVTASLVFIAIKGFEPRNFAEEAAQVVPLEERFPYTIERNSTLATALQNLDVSPLDVHNIVIAAKPYKNLGQLHPGTRFQIEHTADVPAQFKGIKIKLSPQEVLSVQKNNQVWAAEKIIKKIERRVITFKGIVRSSLWESAVEASMNPTLISELAEIFAWQVDFAREVQQGDKWRLSVEEELIQGERVGWGAILSAEYVSAKETHTAVLFRKGEEDMGYFAPDGSSLKRVFLKSPIQYGRISSRFQKRRMHPILKIARAHLGVDYAAPTGTPIRVVGDGVVTSAGFNGGAGHTVVVRHNAVYTTKYKHLSRYAKGIRAGQKVQQGQTIGYVGATGLASGPHLHFEFYAGGRYVDPLGQKFPSADPVPQNYLTEFSINKDTFLAKLPSWDQGELKIQQ